MVLDVPRGFKFVGIHCGIKKCKKDLAIAYSQTGCTAAGVFTTNVVKAAPVLYDMQLLEKNSHNIRALVINSGNANACTGEQGMRNTIRMAEKVAQQLNLPQNSVLVSSQV